MKRDGYVRIKTDAEGLILDVEESFHSNSYKKDEIEEIGYHTLLPPTDYTNAVVLILFSYGQKELLVIDEIIHLFDYNNELKKPKKKGLASFF